VVFSPDGRILASASSDHTVRLWDYDTRQPLGLPLTGHTDEVFAVAFSPDGRTLASSGKDENVWIWDVGVTSWIAQACARANRNLTEAEWEHYMAKSVPYHRTCPSVR
jgi:WD40 repeat protein